MGSFIYTGVGLCGLGTAWWSTRVYLAKGVDEERGRVVSIQ